jgi:uncharacterized protein (TIGR03435 family)
MCGQDDSAVVPGKQFEVVSIRQNVTQGPGTGSSNLAPNPDGFRVTRMSLAAVLLTAYSPQGSNGALFLNTVANLPDWAGRENYDIDARISDADRAAWQDPKNQPAMLQEMLQAMLADRFKLVVHHEAKEMRVYDLAILPSGIKFQETKPDEPRPAGTTLPGGGVLSSSNGEWHLYNFSMGLLATLLTVKSDRTVVDKTGLAGRYSIDIHEPARMDATPDATGETDRMPSMADVLKSVGLELKPEKESVEMLVIDHLERPSAN